MDMAGDVRAQRLSVNQKGSVADLFLNGFGRVFDNFTSRFNILADTGNRIAGGQNRQGEQ
jgi:hypothetical protein